MLLPAEQGPVLLAGAAEPAGHAVAVLRDAGRNVAGEAGDAAELAGERGNRGEA